MLKSIREKLNLKEISIFLIGILVLFTIYLNTRETLFDVYLWLDFNDKVNYMSSEVSYMLTLMHLLIFFLMSFLKNEKI